MHRPTATIFAIAAMAAFLAPTLACGNYTPHDQPLVVESVADDDTTTTTTDSFPPPTPATTAPTLKTGQRIAVKWPRGKPNGKAYEGAVADYKDGWHFIVYDDGDRKWHDLSGRGGWEFEVISAGWPAAVPTAVSITKDDADDTDASHHQTEATEAVDGMISTPDERSASTSGVSGGATVMAMAANTLIRRAAKDRRCKEVAAACATLAALDGFKMSVLSPSCVWAAQTCGTQTSSSDMTSKPSGVSEVEGQPPAPSSTPSTNIQRKNAMRPVKQKHRDASRDASSDASSDATDTHNQHTTSGAFFFAGHVNVVTGKWSLEPRDWVSSSKRPDGWVKVGAEGTVTADGTLEGVILHDKRQRQQHIYSIEKGRQTPVTPIDGCSAVRFVASDDTVRRWRSPGAPAVAPGDKWLGQYECHGHPTEATLRIHHVAHLSSMVGFSIDGQLDFVAVHASEVAQSSSLEKPEKPTAATTTTTRAMGSSLIAITRKKNGKIARNQGKEEPQDDLTTMTTPGSAVTTDASPATPHDRASHHQCFGCYCGFPELFYDGASCEVASDCDCGDTSGGGGGGASSCRLPGQEFPDECSGEDCFYVEECGNHVSQASQTHQRGATMTSLLSADNFVDAENAVVRAASTTPNRPSSVGYVVGDIVQPTRGKHAGMCGTIVGWNQRGLRKWTVRFGEAQSAATHVRPFKKRFKTKHLRAGCMHQEEPHGRWKARGAQDDPASGGEADEEPHAEDECAWEVGDGVGESEAKVGIFDTAEECAAHIRVHYPSANGATFSLRGAGSCYAEFGMRHSDQNASGKWKTCLLRPVTDVAGDAAENLEHEQLEAERQLPSVRATGTPKSASGPQMRRSQAMAIIYRRALELDPRDVGAWAGLESALRAEGDESGADEALSRISFLRTREMEEFEWEAETTRTAAPGPASDSRESAVCSGACMATEREEEQPSDPDLTSNVRGDHTPPTPDVRSDEHTAPMLELIELDGGNSFELRVRGGPLGINMLQDVYARVVSNTASNAEEDANGFKNGVSGDLDDPYGTLIVSLHKPPAPTTGASCTEQATPSTSKMDNTSINEAAAAGHFIAQEEEDTQQSEVVKKTLLKWSPHVTTGLQ